MCIHAQIMEGKELNPSVGQFVWRGDRCHPARVLEGGGCGVCMFEDAGSWHSELLVAGLILCDSGL